MVVFLLNTEIVQILQGFQTCFFIMGSDTFLFSLKEQHGEPSVLTDPSLLNEITSVAHTHTKKQWFVNLQLKTVLTSQRFCSANEIY